MAEQKKTDAAFRTIAEVSELVGVEQYVLRYWESKFRQLRPVKRKGNRRLYRPLDVSIIAGLKKLLHEDSYTLKGVQKIFSREGTRRVAAIGDSYLRERSPDGCGSGIADSTQHRTEGQQITGKDSASAGGLEGTPCSPASGASAQQEISPGGEDQKGPSAVGSERLPQEVTPSNGERKEPAKAKPEAASEIDTGAAEASGRRELDSALDDPAVGPRTPNPESGISNSASASSSSVESRPPVISIRGKEYSFSKDSAARLDPQKRKRVRQLMSQLESLRNRISRELLAAQEKFGLATDA